MKDRLIIEEASRLVSEGVCVTLPVNGQSMLPFIIGGKESVILQEEIDELGGYDSIEEQRRSWERLKEKVEKAEAETSS